jgi:hypothetical protein
VPAQHSGTNPLTRKSISNPIRKLRQHNLCSSHADDESSSVPNNPPGADEGDSKPMFIPKRKHLRFALLTVISAVALKYYDRRVRVSIGREVCLLQLSNRSAGPCRLQERGAWHRLWRRPGPARRRLSGHQQWSDCWQRRVVLLNQNNKESYTDQAEVYGSTRVKSFDPC